MKKKIGILLIITIVCIVINLLYMNISLSASLTTIDPSDYRPSNPSTDDSAEVIYKVKIVLGAIRNISAVVSVIVLMIIGFKYMLGSVEQRANYKATLVPYIIGCILAVSGTSLVSFIYNAMH